VHAVVSVRSDGTRRVYYVPRALFIEYAMSARILLRTKGFDDAIEICAVDPTRHRPVTYYRATPPENGAPAARYVKWLRELADLIERGEQP